MAKPRAGEEAQDQSLQEKQLRLVGVFRGRWRSSRGWHIVRRNCAVELGLFFISCSLVLWVLADRLLRVVAKRKTLFDDRPVEIAELTYVIKQDLASLNSQISSLQTLSKSQQAQISRNSGAEQEGEHNKNVRLSNPLLSEPQY